MIEENKQLQAIRGMNDLLPATVVYWQHVEKILRALTKSYGYNEIRFPIVEYTALFKRSIGDVTDIVEKEMYTFEDRNGDSLTLRPEGTVGCVRAALQNGLLHNQIQRLWYLGPMFRHERPQRGRYRQFYQFGVEAFGLAGPDIDAEQILLSAKLWKMLGVDGKVTLQLNTLGTKEIRNNYRHILIQYFKQHLNQLDDDSQRRLATNPLRILDSKNPAMQELINQAPVILDCLDSETHQHFTELQNILRAAKIDYVINPHLVRGLDYYGLTVFEWVTTSSDRAQNTICAGGRYDGLVEQLGGAPTKAVGFALGLERVIDLIINDFSITSTLDVYLIAVGDLAEKQGIILAEKLREALPKISLLVNCGGGNFKTQFKRADKSLARYALILGENEIANEVITLKNLRSEQAQQTLTFDEIVQFFRNSVESMVEGYVFSSLETSYS